MNTGQVDKLLNEIVSEQPYPLLFVTISGAHLYGFASADSDFDIRGVHVLPAAEVLGLGQSPETIGVDDVREGFEMDLVTHDVKKFSLMLLKPNGYVLEQLYSPFVVHTTPEHDELKRIAQGVVTRRHVHHYIGFARRQWLLFEKSKRIKPLLYTYRVILTGIHMMQSGEVEANLATLNSRFKLSHVDELIEQKRSGGEKDVLKDCNIDFHRTEYQRLVVELERAGDQSSLPSVPSGRDALHDLIVKLRLQQA